MENIELLILDKVDFDKQIDSFFSQNKNNFSAYNLLQSKFWGEVQEGYGRKCFYIIYKKKNKIIAFSLVIETVVAGLVRYFYIPRGPVFEENIDIKDKINIFLSLSILAKEKKAIFIRFEPLNLLKHKLIKKVKDVQPAKTSFLDLNQSEENILSAMKQKTRYNIKLAQKKDLKFVNQKDLKLAYNNFINLLKDTSLRDSFSIHSNNYYKNLIDYNTSFIRVFEVYYKNKVIASGVFSFFDNCVSYLHGASSNNFRNLMAPYLLHFEIIKLAKKENFKFYDLYGVDDKKWPGVSRFKNGFGGNEFDYPGTFDFIVSPFYYFIFRIFKILRKGIWWK